MELAEESRRNAGVLLRMLEANAGHWMKEKEIKLEWARKRNRELKSELIKTEVARRRWQKVAKEKEATIAELSSVVDAAESSTTTADEQMKKKKKKKKMVCRVCGRQRSSVVLLPCHHLCSCQPCEPALVSCPVCQTHKKGSINVFLSLNPY